MPKSRETTYTVAATGTTTSWAFYGLSWGALVGGVVLALAERLNTAVLLGGGPAEEGFEEPQYGGDRLKEVGPRLVDESATVAVEEAIQGELEAFLFYVMAADRVRHVQIRSPQRSQRCALG